MDLTGWLEYFVEGLAAQLAEVRKRGEQAIQRDVLVKENRLSYRQAMAPAHILEHAGGGWWDLIEVKSSSEAKEEHLGEVTFQKYVDQAAGIRIGRCYVTHVIIQQGAP